MSTDTTDTKENQLEPVILVPLPKIVFMWPTAICAAVNGIYMSFDHARNENGPVVAAVVFLVILAINLVVLSFDFPRTTSLTLFFVVVAAVMAGMLLMIYAPNLLPWVSDKLARIRPMANAPFYYVYFVMMAVIFVGVAISTRFDYWEVRGNELLHHHGMLSNLERFPAPQLKIDKEIKDIFEYMLLGSGRLILHPSHEPRAIVLENVAWINRKEEAVTRMLGALHVRIRAEPEQDMT